MPNKTINELEQQLQNCITQMQAVTQSPTTNPINTFLGCRDNAQSVVNDVKSALKEVERLQKELKKVQADLESELKDVALAKLKEGEEIEGASLVKRKSYDVDFNGALNKLTPEILNKLFNVRLNVNEHTTGILRNSLTPEEFDAVMPESQIPIELTPKMLDIIRSKLSFDEIQILLGADTKQTGVGDIVNTIGMLGVESTVSIKESVAFRSAKGKK